MSDKRAFEALLKDLMSAHADFTIATESAWDEALRKRNEALNSVLQAYDAGREGQPVAYLYPDDLAELERVGAALVYQERQRFSILPHQEPAMALFTHPAPKADVAADWVCSGCGETVQPQDVTFAERHDPRHGGCGGECFVPLAASPARVGEGEK